MTDANQFEPATLTVPDVTGQAYVFAKGILQDHGFAWHVTGPVRGYAANVVTSQKPAPGTSLVDTGAPTVDLTLQRNTSYVERGTPDNDAPYSGTAVKLATGAAQTPSTFTPKLEPVAVPQRRGRHRLLRLRGRRGLELPHPLRQPLQLPYQHVERLLTALGRRARIREHQPQPLHRLVRRPHELLELPRPAVGALDGEDVRRVVPPGAVAGELGDRHHLQAVDAELLQVVEFADDAVELGRHRVVRLLVVERADVQFVDDVFGKGKAAPVLVCPLEMIGVHNLGTAMDAFRQSGYLERATAERAAKNAATASSYA